MEKRFGKTVITLAEGDITRQNVDAIVNAANSRLAHGGGVAGAIVKHGGEIIQEESNTWVFARGEVPVGGAAITSAGCLSARYVIHAVGPKMGEGDEDKKLIEAVFSSLRLAEKHKLQSIAFPAISAGIFGYPIKRCAMVMLTTLTKYCQGQTSLEEIVLCLFGREAFDIFQTAYEKIAGKAG